MRDRLEQLNALTVKVDVGFGMITGVLSKRTRIKVAFADDDDYDSSDTTALESYPSELVTKLVAGRRQGFFTVLSQSEDEPITDEDVPLTKESREFRVMRDTVEVFGTSPDQRILIESVGMRVFSVHLDDNIVEELDCASFTGMFERAFANLWSDYRMALKVIRDQVYSTNIANSGI